jgi:hypothetical protein
MQVALKRAVREKQEFRLIPVVLPEADADAIPAFLQLRTWVDFRDGINSDIAFKRLVAGIRGQATDFEGIELPDEPAPYRGLLHFEADHARFFFGRGQEIGPTKDKPNLVDKLRVNRFVAVVGSSGSGKSSIVRAGLLPRLNRGCDSRQPPMADDHVRARPRPIPLAGQRAGARVARGRTRPRRDQSAGPVRRAGSRTAKHAGDVVRGHFRAAAAVHRPVRGVVHARPQRPDRRRGAPKVRRADRPLHPSTGWRSVQRPDGRFRAVITLRADFIPHCLRVTELKNLIQERQMLLGELATDDEALREIIQRPAHEVGAMLETGLMEVLLADVHSQSGALPLLEHALSELWRARRGPWLTLDAYKSSGGVGGALEKASRGNPAASDRAAAADRPPDLRQADFAGGGHRGRSPPRRSPIACTPRPPTPPRSTPSSTSWPAPTPG